MFFKELAEKVMQIFLCVLNLSQLYLRTVMINGKSF